jgi:hypothetical protein
MKYVPVITLSELFVKTVVCDLCLNLSKTTPCVIQDAAEVRPGIANPNASSRHENGPGKPDVGKIK